jgi:hypothetical protein
VMGAATGSSGNGGAVTVTNNSLIRTSGANAIGILAQSVGGGGGVPDGGRTRRGVRQRVHGVWRKTGGARSSSGALVTGRTGNRASLSLAYRIL